MEDTAAQRGGQLTVVEERDIGDFLQGSRGWDIGEAGFQDLQQGVDISFVQMDAP